MVPGEVQDRLALTSDDILYYSDPCTAAIYDFTQDVPAIVKGSVSRIIVDLNRPPYHLPPKHPDGAIKSVTVDGTPVYRDGWYPDITLMHRLMMEYYFSYHAGLDHLLGEGDVMLALDCHSMLPVGPPGQRDAGKKRPLVCLGNNGDRIGNQKPGLLSTCPAPVIQALASAFSQLFPGEGNVAINTPFSGGFISNAHYWHKGVPWIQVEINRVLYESEKPAADGYPVQDSERVRVLNRKIRSVFCEFYEGLQLL
jgi:N-formylglutamate deformylase